MMVLVGWKEIGYNWIDWKWVYTHLQRGVFAAGPDSPLWTRYEGEQITGAEHFTGDYFVGIGPVGVLPYPRLPALVVAPRPEQLVMLSAARRMAAAEFVRNSSLRLFPGPRTRNSWSAVFQWGDVSPEYRGALYRVFPDTPELFFRLLESFVPPFEWQLTRNGEVEIRAPHAGRFIGRGGRVVKALAAHLGRPVRVTAE